MVRNPFDFSGRNALVTGCGSADGIGYAAAARAAHGPIDVLVNAAGMVQTGTR